MFCFIKFVVITINIFIIFEASKEIYEEIYEIMKDDIPFYKALVIYFEND